MEPRNYEAGASESAPIAPDTPSVGYPSAGNPATGTPATRPGAFWFYKIGESLRRIIVAADLTPSDNDLDQLKHAIEVLGTVQQASESEAGKAAIATQQQTNAGANDTRFVTPKKLDAKIKGMAIGFQQSWQDVSASRSSGVVYTNTTGRPIQVQISVGGDNSNNKVSDFYIDGLLAGKIGKGDSGSTSIRAAFNAVIPHQSTYRVVNQSMSIAAWLELR